ncbi:MAG TPA: TetR/AcrR family transcriptional regulator [Rhizomicrobium sp.]|jgi:AcrR family transcriptional regulator|nr:TetR/AcrR family transcriptional regulator [Rhizomicrobium sp.]
MGQVQQRWSRRKEARPQEILEAALAVFAERGFAAARMDEVARRAGVTKGTIYLYFPSKEELFKSLVREAIGGTLQQVTAFAETYDGSARAILESVLRTIGTLMRTSDRVVLPKIILAESGNFPELVRFYRFEIIEKGLALLQSIIRRGIARGEFRDVPPEHAARLCVAPLLLGALWRSTFAPFDPEPYDIGALVETHIDVLLRGLEREK